MFRDENVTPKKLILSSLFGFLGSICFSVLLIFIFSAIINLSTDPLKLIVPMSLTALYLSSAAGGVVSAYLSNSVFSPVICGSTLMCMALILMLSAPGECIFTPTVTALLLVCIIITSSMGGIAVLLAHKKGPRRNKRRR